MKKLLINQNNLPKLSSCAVNRPQEEANNDTQMPKNQNLPLKAMSKTSINQQFRSSSQHRIRIKTSAGNPVKQSTENKENQVVLPNRSQQESENLSNTACEGLQDSGMVSRTNKHCKNNSQPFKGPSFDQKFMKNQSNILRLSTSKKESQALHKVAKGNKVPSKTPSKFRSEQESVCHSRIGFLTLEAIEQSLTLIENYLERDILPHKSTLKLKTLKQLQTLLQGQKSKKRRFDSSPYQNFRPYSVKMSNTTVVSKGKVRQEESEKVQQKQPFMSQSLELNSEEFQKFRKIDMELKTERSVSFENNKQETEETVTLPFFNQTLGLKETIERGGAKEVEFNSIEIQTTPIFESSTDEIHSEFERQAQALNQKISLLEFQQESQQLQLKELVSSNEFLQQKFNKLKQEFQQKELELQKLTKSCGTDKQPADSLFSICGIDENFQKKQNQGECCTGDNKVEDTKEERTDTVSSPPQQQSNDPQKQISRYETAQQFYELSRIDLSEENQMLHERLESVEKQLQSLYLTMERVSAV